MKWKLYLNLVALAGVALLAYMSRDTFVAAWEIMLQTNWRLIIIGTLVIRSLGFLASSRYYQSFLKLFGFKIRLWPAIEAAMGTNFVSQVFPSGGFFSLSWLTVKLSSEKVPATTALLTQLSRYILTSISYLILLVASAVILVATGKLSFNTAILIAVLAAMIIVSTWLIIFITQNRSRIHRYAAVIVKIINAGAVVIFFFSKYNKRLDITAIEDVLNKFHEESQQVMRHRGILRQPLLDLTLFNIAEIALIYIVFLAFGELIDPATAIIAYGVATMVSSLISVTPAGIGIYEAAMVFTFAALGLPSGLGLSVTLVYRVAHLLLFLPVGFYFYQRVKLSKAHG